MLIKLVGEEGRSRMYECSHVQFTHLSDGIEAELGSKGPTLRLPDDGRAIYVMNDRGDTVDSYRWPPKGDA